jgi:transcriptional regulator with XRE-family HTH domain
MSAETTTVLKPHKRAIMALLAERDMTQGDLANLAGYSRSQMNNILNARPPYNGAPAARLNPYRAPLIARGLGIDIAKVLFYFRLSRKYLDILEPNREVLT